MTGKREGIIAFKGKSMLAEEINNGLIDKLINTRSRHKNGEVI